MTRASLLIVLAAACAKDKATPPATTSIADILSAPDRGERDRKLDKFRKPAELFAWIDVKPGMHVADLGAGAGYTTELMARAVGPQGSVIAQDSPNWAGDWMTKAWDERMKRPALAHTTHVMRSWEEPLPPDAKNLDVVTFVAAYHDVVAEKQDPTKLDAAVFAALKPGGVFLVIDSSAKAGSGTADCESLHRIDEAVVRDQVEKAGFRLAGQSDFLRNPADTRDWNSDPSPKNPRSHTQDLFALEFVKPAT